eukprot:Pgem_evm1s4549
MATNMALSLGMAPFKVLNPTLNDTELQLVFVKQIVIPTKTLFTIPVLTSKTNPNQRTIVQGNIESWLRKNVL